MELAVARVLFSNHNIGDIEFAWILNVFLICYAVMYPVSGILVDKFGPKPVMFGGIAAWSLACIGGGCKDFYTYCSSIMFQVNVLHQRITKDAIRHATNLPKTHHSPNQYISIRDNSNTTIISALSYNSNN